MYEGGTLNLKIPVVSSWPITLVSVFLYTSVIAPSACVILNLCWLNTLSLNSTLHQRGSCFRRCCSPICSIQTEVVCFVPESSKRQKRSEKIWKLFFPLSPWKLQAVMIFFPLHCILNSPNYQIN